MDLNSLDLGTFDGDLPGLGIADIFNPLQSPVANFMGSGSETMTVISAVSEPDRDVDNETLPQSDFDDETIPMTDAESLATTVEAVEDVEAVENVETVEAVEAVENVETVEFDPMRFDYMVDVGVRNINDPQVALTGMRIFRESRTEDVPCRFHDGFSGKCWKKNCHYSHQRYTGGVFAEQHPSIAMAAGCSVPVTICNQMPHKVPLERQAVIACRVVYVNNPTEFYIRPVGDKTIPLCTCHLMDNIVSGLRMKQMEREHVSMDSYYHGFGNEVGLQNPNEGQGRPILQRVDEAMNEYLASGMTYKKYQAGLYRPHVELVAVRVNEKWWRGIVRPSSSDTGDEVSRDIRVQLLETGETVRAHIKDVCQLPRQFCSVQAGAYKCSLFGLSPVWKTWSLSCISKFKELVLYKEVRIIVVDVPFPLESAVTFQTYPYIVKILVKDSQGTVINVAEAMLKEGNGLPWNQVPLRPLAQGFLPTGGIDMFRSTGQMELPRDVLEQERIRMAVYQNFGGTGFASDEDAPILHGYLSNAERFNRTQQYVESTHYYLLQRPEVLGPVEDPPRNPDSEDNASGNGSVPESLDEA